MAAAGFGVCLGLLSAGAGAAVLAVADGAVEHLADGQCALLEAIANANKDDQIETGPGECPAGSGADVITLPPASQFEIPRDLIIEFTSELTIAGQGASWGSSGWSSLIVRDGGHLEVSDLTIAATDSLFGALPFQIEKEGTLVLDRVVLRGMPTLPLENEGVLVLVASEVIGNYPSFGTGAILNRGTLTLLSSTIDSNGVFGIGGTGGITNGATGRVFIDKSIISGNSTGSMVGVGGGIYNVGQLVINDSSMIENGSRTFGAGIYNRGQLWVTNSTFSNNWPDGIYNDFGGEATLSHITLTNTGTLYNEAEMTLKNSIVAGDDRFALCINEGNLHSGTNLISDGSCDASMSGAAMLDPAGLYGGPTPTARPQLSSPALDAAADDDCEQLDQRGVERPEFYCDLGAHERIEGIVFQNGFEGYRYW